MQLASWIYTGRYFLIMVLHHTCIKICKYIYEMYFLIYVKIYIYTHTKAC